MTGDKHFDDPKHVLTTGGIAILLVGVVVVVGLVAISSLLG
jgi:hypothetical protein